MRMTKSKGLRKGALALVLGALVAACSSANTGAKDAGADIFDATMPIADGPAPTGDAVIRDDLVSGEDAVSTKLDGKLDVSTVLSDGAMEVGGRDSVVNDGTAGTCVGPENTAPTIVETVVSDPPPVAKGGTIEPGLYYETSWIRYNNLPTPPDAGRLTTHHQTTTIDSSLKMVVSTTTADTGEPTAFAIQLDQATPTSLWFEFVCPYYTGVPLYNYDATPGSVTFYQADTISPYSYTLMKQ
jgi:hypothetical protein